MSSGEEGTPMKHHKPASSVQEVPIVTAPHPDRPSSMQAYYGGAAPPTFYASTVVTPTPHPNMWGVQHHFMPSYGTPMPYPALFPPGEIFTHPTLPADPNLAPTNGEFGIKLSDRKERMSTKKTEGASGSTSIVVGKGTVSQKPSSSSGNGPNLCPESGVDGSSDASEDNTANHEPAAGKKRNIHQMLANGNIHPSDAVAPGAIVVHDGVMPDQWVHDERELKRQKRMQSNREAARRSRLRKQAECEQLQGRIDTLNNENHRLKEELQRLSEECEKVASENQSIKEELLRICGPDDLSRLEIILQEAGGDS